MQKFRQIGEIRVISLEIELLWYENQTFHEMFHQFHEKNKFFTNFYLKIVS